jgi:plasmid stability protein
MTSSKEQIMAVITIPDMDEATVERLADLAREHRRSIEEEAAILLKQALAAAAGESRWKSADRIAAMTPKGVKQTDSVVLLREDRDR